MGSKAIAKRTNTDEQIAALCANPFGTWRGFRDVRETLITAAKERGIEGIASVSETIRVIAALQTYLATK
jgi:hypothetical protein